MSVPRSQEQDLNLKLRVMRYLWDLGYLVRKNVMVMEPQTSGKQYTDIDVLAIKIDEELNPSVVICDCKSGQQAKTRERMFWLSGVMDFFGATQGIFLRSRLYGGKYVELAKRLGIMPISEEHLTTLERAYGIDTDSFGSFSDEHIKGEKIFSVFREFSPRTVDYLNSYYWEDLPAQQIATLISCCTEIRESRDLEPIAKNFLIVYSLSSLALSIDRFARNVLMIPESSKPEFIKVELFGGLLEHDERKELLKAFHDFMTKEIRERYKEKYPITSSQFLDTLTPYYAKYLADLVMRICNNPRNYIFLPRVFDLLAYEVILGGKDLKIEHFIQNASYLDPTAVIKPAKDFLAFAERSELLTPELNELLKKKVEMLT
jgi:hypothetical protein